jgi:hypothetical protein
MIGLVMRQSFHLSSAATRHYSTRPREVKAKKMILFWIPGQLLTAVNNSGA